MLETTTSHHLKTIAAVRELRQQGYASTHPEALALLLLYQHDDPIPMGAISDAIDLSRAAITTLVDRLAGAKLIKRHYDYGGDRRRVHIELTPRGRRAVEKANP